MNLDNITSADNLQPEDAALIKRLRRVLSDNERKHSERRLYYDDKVRVKNRGMDVPKASGSERFCTGWARKSVDALAERSVFDSFTFAGEVPEGFSDAMAMNAVDELYKMAAPAAIRDGVGFWNVSADDDTGVSINFNDAMTASALWDYKRRMVKAGMVIEDWKSYGNSSTEIPCLVVVKKKNQDIVIERTDRSKWVATYMEPHNLGIPMMVPMVYKRSADRPFGQSRITNAVMTYASQAQTELFNMAVQSDFFSIPMKYILGASDDQYRKLSENVMKAYKTDMLVMTPNDDGGNPTVGMLQAASMEPHIAVLDKLASMMASETSMPVATFGVAGNGYTSSDALRASTDDLVILAKAFNGGAADALSMVAKMAICVLHGCGMDGLTESERTVTAHFRDPSMPSDAQNADAMLKVCSVAPEFAGTDVFWEKLGYNEDDRRRIATDTAAKSTASEIRAALYGNDTDGVARA